jgi:hypothetical protein
MVLIMATSLFPPDKGKEVQKKFNEIQSKCPMPSFIKQKNLSLRWIRGGLKAIAIYNVEKGKVSDALSFVYRYDLEFSGIEGYSTEIETLLTTKEMPSM